MNTQSSAPASRGFCGRSKEEVASKPLHSRKEKLAFLSAVFVSNGSLLIHGGSVAVTLTSRNKAVTNAVCAVARDLGKECVTTNSGHNTQIAVENALPLLRSCGVLDFSGETISVCEHIPPEFGNDSATASAYVRGAYLGAGSLSLGKYHLEFTFGRRTIAEDFARILSDYALVARLSGRGERTVVYLKDNQQISDCLAFMGAGRAVLGFNDIVVERQMSGHVNRQKNCDLHNIEKQVETGLKQCAQIRELDLGALSKPLREAAKARLGQPEASYEELSGALGITKSGLKNRLRRLSEIYEKQKQ